MKTALLSTWNDPFLGQIIASGGQGQVRKGEFSGKAVAIKELLAVMFDPKATEALQVRVVQGPLVNAFYPCLDLFPTITATD